MVPFERAKVSSYRLPIVTFPLSVIIIRIIIIIIITFIKRHAQSYRGVSEILPLLCSRAPFFPLHL